MNQSLISVGSNFEPTHNIRKVLERIESQDISRIFVTKSEEPSTGVFYNLALLSKREYSQEELNQIELSLGRAKGVVSEIEIDLDLQMQGECVDLLSTKRFNASAVLRTDWADFGFAAVPCSDLFTEIALPDRPSQLIVPEDKHIEWLKNVLGAFDLLNMPQLEGSIAHHEHFMDRVLDYLLGDWQPPDFPIASGVVYNGEIVALGRSTPRSTQDSTAHAEMNVLREASKKLGRVKLRDAWLYSTHAPCGMCRATTFECGVKGIVWAIDPWDAPSLYNEKLTDAVEAFKNNPRTTFYREIGKERALSVCNELASKLTAKGRPKKEYSTESSEREVTPVELYDALAEEYLDPELHPVSFAVAIAQRNLRTVFAEIVDGVILDVGCGSEVPPVVNRFHGVDLSPKMVEERNRKAPGEITEIGEATQLPVDSGSFGGVFAGLVIDHVDDLLAVANEFARVLKPEGHVWITLLAPNKLPEQVYKKELLHMRSADNIVYKAPINRWTEADLKQAFGSQFTHNGSSSISLSIRGFELTIHKLTLNK